MASDEELLDRIGTTPSTSDGTFPDPTMEQLGLAPDSEVEDEAPTDGEPENPEAGDDADATDPREAAYLERMRALELREKEMERGFQRKMQKVSRELKTVQERAKVEREVAFLAQKMAENPQFAGDFQQLANQYGIRLPDVTPDDIESAVKKAMSDFEERFEAAETERRTIEYQRVVAEEAARLMKEHNIKQPEVDAIFKVAVNPKLPLLRAGMTRPELAEALDLAAAKVLISRAKTEGQRDLLNRAKNKVRTAAAAAHAAQPAAEPQRLPASWDDAEKQALAAIRSGGFGQ